MIQISNKVYCDDFLESCCIQRILPNPYYDLPYLVIKNFLPIEICHQISRYTYHENEKERAKVKTMVLGSVADANLNEQIRKTNIYTLPNTLLEKYQNSFLSHQKLIEEYFNVALTFSTEVQTLEYTKGYFYKKHADDSNDIINEDGETIGFQLVAPHRKITTVLFATSYSDTPETPYSFKGGNLKFNYLHDKEGKNIELFPEAGDMVIFPSNPYFSHEVIPVEEGYRLTLVQWHNAII